MSEEMTTAQALGKFRKELLEEGVPEDEADYIVRSAADETLRSTGFVVK